MSRINPFIFGFLFLISCAQEYQPRKIEKVTITTQKIDSSSIRTLVAIDNENMSFAGSLGNFSTTSNGGKTWSTLTLKYQDSIVPHFRSLAFNGHDYFALSIGNPALLYKISEDKATIAYSESHENVFYDALTFFDDNRHGIAVGDPTENCASIIITADSGETWQKIPCDNLPEIAQGEAFFAASNTNIKTMGSTVWIASGGTKARVLKSTNFGKSWQVYNTPIAQGNGPQGIYSIDFYDENNGFIIGGNYEKPTENNANKALTTDGGKTWQLVGINTTPNYKSCVQYVPNTGGKELFVVGKTGVSFSNDGGKTFSDVSKDGFYAIQFVDENTAWLTGHKKVGKMSLQKK